MALLDDSQSLDKHLLFKPSINDRLFLRECEEPTTYFIKRDFTASFGFDSQDERQLTSESSTNFDDDANRNTESDNSFNDVEEGDREFTIAAYKSPSRTYVRLRQMRQKQQQCQR